MPVSDEIAIMFPTGYLIMITEEENDFAEKIDEQDGGEHSVDSSADDRKILPRINFRVFLFCALGLMFGIFLYAKIRFGGLNVSDFLFIAFFLFFAALSFAKKRLITMLACILFFACTGALSIHLYTQNYLSGAESGEYDVTGVVDTVSAGNGYATAELSSLTFDGRRTGGKMQVRLLAREVRFGEVLSFRANVTRKVLPSGDFYANYCFEKDIRYFASVSVVKTVGMTGNPFLRLKSAVYETLHENLGRDEADLSFGLLTGDTRGMDGSLKEAVQKGGIAHLFAVSGLHIGILFAAVALLCKPLGKYSFVPAFAAAILYVAFCGFSVSSVRAAIMCGILGANRLIGRKTDLLQSLSLAAICILLIMPAQWLSAGFRLSSAAVSGLALFSGTFARGFGRLRLPSFLSGYLGANLSVQLVTFPILIECFGYFSVWGFLLNFFLIPLMPVLFPLLLADILLALAIPPWAAFFLAIPNGIVSLLPYLFAAADFSFVLTGFSLGAGGIVWFTGAVALSERFRLGRILRAVAAGLLCCMFAVCLVVENAVFSGCKIVTESGSSGAALVRTDKVAVLIIGGDISHSACEAFLACSYGGTLDAVVVLSDDKLDGINVGAFLPAKRVHARDEIATGLQKTEVVFGETFSCGELTFRYESRKKLTMAAEGRIVEFDFSDGSALGADLFVGKGRGGLKYFLKDGKINAI